MRGVPLVLALSSVLFFTSSVRAAVPGEVSYQGLLLDDLGEPVTGTVAMSFTLFDALAAGSALWTEAHPTVDVVDGVYDVVLGATTPLDAAVVAGGTLYLEVSVEGDPLTPRQPLLAVPYALRSAATEAVGTLPATFIEELFEHTPFDGGAPPNTDPSEGVGDVDGDGTPNFLDPDNDGDSLSDVDELAQGSDINLVTPVITGFAPTVAEGVLVTPIQVHGQNFEPGMTVQFGIQSPVPMNVTPTQFEVDVGPQPAGTVNVDVTRTNGESSSTSFDFANFAPTIDSFSPGTLELGEAGTVTVFGTNFYPGLSVQFGSETPTPFNVTPTSFDVAIAGTEPLGPVTVVVTSPNGLQANDDSFQIGNFRIVFVTSQTTTGNIGGLLAADALCNQLAGNAGLSGTFQAWLADSTGSPSTRSTQIGSPYVTSVGGIIANDWADLTDGAIGTAVRYDETGLQVAGRVWSSVLLTGAFHPLNRDCVDWTSDSSGEVGFEGDTGLVTGGWTDAGASASCDTAHPLYCIEQ